MSESHIHTSGHADKDSLQKLIGIINPKTIIPIHTFQPQDYQKYFKTPIKMLKDRETFLC